MGGGWTARTPLMGLGRGAVVCDAPAAATIRATASFPSFFKEGFFKEGK